MNIKTDYTLDFRGSITPITLLKITQVFREMKPNGVIEIIGSDPDIQNDLFKVLPENSYELICDSANAAGKRKSKGGYYSILLKKREKPVG